MPARQEAPCVVCHEMLDVADAGAVFPIMCRLVGVADLGLSDSLGIPDAPKSESGQVYMCVECCVADAMGKIALSRSPFSVLAHELLSRMTAKNPAVMFSAWNDLRERQGLQPVRFQQALPAGQILPPQKRLQAAG